MYLGPLSTWGPRAAGGGALLPVAADLLTVVVDHVDDYLRLSTQLTVDLLTVSGRLALARSSGRRRCGARTAPSECGLFDCGHVCRRLYTHLSRRPGSTPSWKVKVRCTYAPSAWALVRPSSSYSSPCARPLASSATTSV
eukprot:1181390-Prorocentrum_minimum.AAC.1